ncbi:MAG: nucleotidyltransferase domain-containing protein [Deltaproteobacteria bacterium]|nr:nucleotidyltransferase domain-containing protein [Deltaproteobacteria bacterium]
MARAEKKSDVLSTLVRRLAEQFGPDKIILFGSRAREEASDQSDFDLLVITDYQGSKRKLAVAMRLALADLPCSKDIIVASPEEIARLGEIPGYVYKSALREGRVVYAQE